MKQKMKMLKKLLILLFPQYGIWSQIGMNHQSGRIGFQLVQQAKRHGTKSNRKSHDWIGIQVMGCIKMQSIGVNFLNALNKNHYLHPE